MRHWYPYLSLLMLVLVALLIVVLYERPINQKGTIHYIPRDRLPADQTQKVRNFFLTEVDALPVWSVDTKVNQISCNRKYKEKSSGWVIKQWKNQDSLCNDKSTTEISETCQNASSELATNTARYCHWNTGKQILLSLDAKKMENYGCNPNARGNVGGFVSYLAWEPRMLPDYYKKQERYMVRNMWDIYTRFDFKNEYVDSSFVCGEALVDAESKHKKAIVHSYATATFSEIDSVTKKGTGRTIFYQILNYDARLSIQQQIRGRYHFYLTCDYKSNEHSTMIYRDSVSDFGQDIALPSNNDGSKKFVSYEFSLFDGVRHGLSQCYSDADFNKFKFTGFHIGTEIKNGAKHEFVIRNPEIEIIYKNKFEL